MNKDAWICKSCYQTNPGFSIENPCGPGVDECEGCGLKRDDSFADSCEMNTKWGVYGRERQAGKSHSEAVEASEQAWKRERQSRGMP